MPTGHVVFLPWTRQGAAAAIETVDTLAPQTGAAILQAALTVNDTPPVVMPVRLLGPADVIGINPQDIVRREPPPDTANFEHNLFVSVDFDRPDYPWLFTPASADSRARLRPWLCLIVVRRQEGVSIRTGTGSTLPSIEITTPAVVADELPNPPILHLWAHAQVMSDGTSDVNILRNTLAASSELSLSRLICPRLLVAGTDYIACVVPAFLNGCKAGLGQPADSAETLEPSWSAVSLARGSITLPFYDHWSFHTGSGGDFRTLAKLLRAKPSPAGLGKRAVNISHPGFELPATFPQDARLDFEGALEPMKADDGSPWPEGAEKPFETTLADIVNAADEVEADSDPLLAPPLYGQWHALRSAVDPETAQSRWFDELNLDPRHRSAAGLGTRVVQEHQETLMASAWQQAGDMLAGNRRLRQLQMSVAVGASLHARYFDRMQPDALLRAAAPALARVRTPAVLDADRAGTLLSALEGTSVQARTVAPSMRKLSRVRGPLSCRVSHVSRQATGLTGFLKRINFDFTFDFPQPVTPNLATFDALRTATNSPAILRYSAVTQETVDAMPGAPQFQLMPEGARIPMPVEGVDLPVQDNAVAMAFRAAASAHLKKLSPGRPWKTHTRVQKAADLVALRPQLSAQMQPQSVLVALANALVVGNRSRAEPKLPVSTTMHVPTFAQPMYEALRELSQDLLLPGLNSVKQNTVIGLRTNPRFVNAYMVGLNAEMGRELLWRGYPTDQAGTYFRQFWDPAGASTEKHDIDPINEWGTRALGGAAGGDSQFVMLLRSELLRRYPTASIYAVPAVIANGKRVPRPGSELEEHPAFRGSLPPDVTFVGFNLTARVVVGGNGAGHGYFVVI